MEITLDGLVKFLVGVVIAVVSTTAWMDKRFITSAQADTFVSVERVDKMERMITFQELRAIWTEIKGEESKFTDIRNKERLRILYQEELRLKKVLNIK